MICCNPFTGRTENTRLLPVLAIAIGILAPTAVCGQTSNPPTIRYISASAGPNQGWEGSPSRGAAISIWTQNTGSTRGSSYVTVAGVPLTNDSDYAEWGATAAPTTAKGYQRITFWLNSSMQVGDTRGISVNVGGITSNVIPFSINNTGRIYFLSLTGSETNNGRFAATNGNGNGPWSNFSLAATRMRPGDFLYMRGGNWTSIHRDGVQTYSYIGYFESGQGGCVYYQPLINGTDTLRITLTSFPGEVATFERSNIINYSKYWTFTNLRFSNVGANQNLTLGSQWSHCQECSDHSVGLNVIGNEFAGTEHHNIQAFGDNFRIAANYIDVVPVGGGSYGPETAYSLYLSSGIDRLVADNEIKGGAMYGIHAYDEDRESCTDVGRILQNWTIEGNWIDASNAGAGYRSPMLIGAGNLATVDGITVRNNVLYSNGTASLTGIRIFNGNERNISIHNNTFHGLPSGILIDYTSRDIISGISVANNIFSNMVPSSSFPGIAGKHIYNDTGRPAILSVQSNLYDATPVFVNASDASPITANPRYVAPGTSDFHLTSSSPAVNAGMTLTNVGRDYDGNPRPLGGSHDIGAFEFGSDGPTGPAVSLSVSPLSASLGISQSQQFVASVQNASNGNVTWSVTPAIGAVSASGLYTAPSAISEQQTVTVTATSVEDPSKTAAAVVTINPPAAVISVSVSPATAILTAGQSRQLIAAVTGSTNTGVTWTMSPAAGTLSTTGLYVAPASILVQQQVVITARSVADSTKYASATFTLTPPAPVIAVSVSPSTASLLAGRSQQLIATVTGTTNTGVAWTMSPAIGTISASGLYSAPASVTSQQSVVVTATSIADPSKFGRATITINPPATSGSLSLTWTPVSATQVRLTWTAPAGRPTGDWISLTGNGSPSWWYSWVQTTGGATGGSALVTLPTAPGLWQFHYHAAGTYTLLATSSDIPVGVTAFNVATGKNGTGTGINIIWAAPSGRPTNSDLVGLYKVGSTNTQPVAYKYTNGVASGQVTVPVPGPGTYEARYVTGYLATAIGGRFTQ